MKVQCVSLVLKQYRFLFSFIFFMSLGCGLALAEPIEEENIIPDWYQTLTLQDGRYIKILPAEYETFVVTEVVEPAKIVTREIPAVTKQVSRQVLKSPAQTIEKSFPAQTEIIQKRVVKSTAKTSSRTIPAVIRNIKAIDPKTGREYIKELVVQPEYKQLTSIPAVFETVNETIVIAEARTEKVKVPAQFETLYETVIVTPASQKSESIPAVTKKIEKQIITMPARMALFSVNDELLHIFTSRAEFLKFKQNPSSTEFVYDPAPFEQVEETLVIKPKQTEYAILPEQTETMTETVVVQDVSTNVVTIPASYRTVTETVVIQEATVEHISIPAQFETHKERIMIEPAKNGQPAKMRTVEVRKLVRPASIQERVIPPVTKQITTRVIDKPASYQERTIPASTSAQTRRVVKRPEQVVSRQLPKEERTVKRFYLKSNDQAYSYVPELIQDKFVWPSSNTLTEFIPPQTEVKMDIPQQVCGYTQEGTQASLMQVHDNLSAVLNKHRYQKRVFKYPHGFAILTLPERIDEQAETIFTPNSNIRIGLDEHPIDSLGSYFSILFTKPKTKYRYIAFIVSAIDNIESSGEKASPEGLQAIFAEGGLTSDLPQSLHDYGFTNEYKCQAWVYEFSRIDRDDPVSLTGDLFVPAAPSLSEFLHKSGSPVLRTLFTTEQ
ncbi:hypothetical protein [Glaciecola petra]|uniref:Uncharacterized protein n=1 Tax=Glaciecola petra TaxID=3075602 RepID=A0ABU2ZPH6_9ALTE|nr:hypothetical protein [Aestuariibacter sp. P117]MDT0594526.1 hypothetical protein [Aestuariibacter sp. P117]